MADPGYDPARLSRIETQLSSDDRFARLEARQAAIQATLWERRVAEAEAAAAIQRKLEETAKASADALKSALASANDIEVERVGRVHDRISAVTQAAEVALASADKAVTLSRDDAIRTEVKQNEFRGALDDQAKRIELAMMPRKEFEQAHSTLQGEQRQAREQARAEVARLREEMSELRQAIAVGPPELPQLRSRVDTSTGERTGHTSAVVIGVAMIAALAAVALVLAVVFTAGH